MKMVMAMAMAVFIKSIEWKLFHQSTYKHTPPVGCWSWKWNYPFATTMLPVRLNILMVRWLKLNVLKEFHSSECCGEIRGGWGAKGLFVWAVNQPTPDSHIAVLRFPFKISMQIYLLRQMNWTATMLFRLCSIGSENSALVRSVGVCVHTSLSVFCMDLLLWMVSPKVDFRFIRKLSSIVSLLKEFSSTHFYKRDFPLFSTISELHGSSQVVL